jgi:hypothetical protein
MLLQAVAYNTQIAELRVVNETLYATVKAMTVSQASDQRRITELTVLLEEADGEDDPLSV